MSDPAKLSILDLQERYLKALLLSEMSVRTQPDAYRELKQMVSEINSRVVDISEYYSLSLRMAGLLRSLTWKGEVTIFDYFLPNISPAQSGNIRYFRSNCLDLAVQLTGFDKWRADRHRLKCIK